MCVCKHIAFHFSLFTFFSRCVLPCDIDPCQFFQRTIYSAIDRPRFLLAFCIPHCYQSLSQSLPVELVRQGSKCFRKINLRSFRLNLVSIRHQTVEHIRCHPDGEEGHEFFGAAVFLAAVEEPCQHSGTEADQPGTEVRHGMFGAHGILGLLTHRRFLNSSFFFVFSIKSRIFAVCLTDV